MSSHIVLFVHLLNVMPWAFYLMLQGTKSMRKAKIMYMWQNHKNRQGQSYTLYYAIFSFIMSSLTITNMTGHYYKEICLNHRSCGLFLHNVAKASFKGFFM